MTGPGEAFQMDWGFTKVLNPNGAEYQVACFAMICHHCGQRYVELFPNAKQENLFIGMIHAFQYMGIPQYVLTDNMKSVVVKRDLEGHPIWQKDYEAFMKAVWFQTKLCKPRHPFTKGKVERLVRFVKENFLVDRTFQNISDLNWAALNWCNTQNAVFTERWDLFRKRFISRIALLFYWNFLLTPLYGDTCVQNAGCLSMNLSAMREFALVFRPIIFCRQSESLETRIRSESFPTIFHGSWFHIPSRGVDRTKSVQGSLRKYLSQKSFRQLG